jgi:PIN domain nuclease of toxin-antitoxin system
MTLADCFDIIAKTGFTELQINKDDLIELNKLPGIHKDPFDRMLIAQSIRQNLSIITKDAAFVSYKVKMLW